MGYWSSSSDQAIKELNSDLNGLSEYEADSRLKKYGTNELKKEGGVSPLKILLQQFTSYLVLILIAASVISAFVGNNLDAIVIIAIVIFNGIVGFFQEYRAEKSIELLKQMTALKTTVIRDGKKREIDAKLLVPGDIIFLEEGSKVPADCRLILLNNLQTDESSLTGESLPISKTLGVYTENVPMADRKNCLFSGTSVVRGDCTAIVTGTGMSTEIGKIAKEVQIRSPQTPLQQYLDDLGKKIIVGVIAVVGVIFAINYFFKTGTIIDTFLTSISLAVAAVPEGLPAIVTLTSAIGVKKMISRKTLVRRLSAVEALGSVSVICTDKTGTLTESKLTVQKAYIYDKISDIKSCTSDMLFRIGAICNNATLISGDPTEKALVKSAKDFGLDLEKEQKEYSRVKEIPFESVKKRMTVVCNYKNKQMSFMKGAPEVVLELCDKILVDGTARKITKKDVEKINEVVNSLASQALRILAFAYKDGGLEPEKNLVFVGLQGMMDPPRQEVEGAIKTCEEAGIRVVMITGDHALTAKAVAETIGMKVDGRVVTGEEIEKMSEEEFSEAVEKINVFARIEPSHKLRIVKKLRQKKEVVSVTGDGVNDAPALKNSNIGVAMGIRGTDVAKEASDIIITDDNFATIISAVEEGRRIFDNIKKFINYLFTANFGEVLVVFIASLVFFKLPITAVQLLWLNLLTDGFPALALGLDPAKPGIMKEKERRTKIVDKNMLIAIIQTGAIMAAGLLFLFYTSLPDGIMKAQTMVFTGMVMFEFARLYTIEASYKMKIWANKYLLLALIVSILLQVAVIYTPLNSLFGVVQLTLVDWATLLAVLGAMGIANFGLTRLTNKIRPEE